LIVGGPTSKERERGEGREKNGKEGRSKEMRKENERDEREREGRRAPPPLAFLSTPLFICSGSSPVDAFSVTQGSPSERTGDNKLYRQNGQ